jgi:uncharacterized protein with ATP-grasp and redox domains
MTNTKINYIANKTVDIENKIKQDLFVEKVKVSTTGEFLSSIVIPATEKDIEEFKNKPCNHSLHVDKLVYDLPGWPYDSRYCGICNASLGII